MSLSPLRYHSETHPTPLLLCLFFTIFFFFFCSYPTPPPHTHLTKHPGFSLSLFWEAWQKIRLWCVLTFICVMKKPQQLFIFFIKCCFFFNRLWSLLARNVWNIQMFDISCKGNAEPAQSRLEKTQFLKRSKINNPKLSPYRRSCQHKVHSHNIASAVR